jgi:hypothetical protein
MYASVASEQFDELYLYSALRLVGSDSNIPSPNIVPFRWYQKRKMVIFYNVTLNYFECISVIYEDHIKKNSVA